jgi:hypothetical protein
MTVIMYSGSIDIHVKSKPMKYDSPLFTHGSGTPSLSAAWRLVIPVKRHRVSAG